MSFLMMTDNNLTLIVSYNMSSGKFDIEGDIKKEKQVDLIYEFLRTQIGKGKDDRKATEREIYKIKLRWFPHLDEFSIEDNICNYGLREGILIDVAGKLKSQNP